MERGRIDLCQLEVLRPGKALIRRDRDTVAITSFQDFVKLPKKKTRDIYVFYVAIILFLMWPVTFGAPLLTSAVEWLSKTVSAVEVPFNDTDGTGNEILRDQWKRLLTEGTSKCCRT
jgi:hypothetical protein